LQIRKIYFYNIPKSSIAIRKLGTFNFQLPFFYHESPLMYLCQVRTIDTKETDSSTQTIHVLYITKMYGNRKILFFFNFMVEVTNGIKDLRQQNSFSSRHFPCHERDFDFFISFIVARCDRKQGKKKEKKRNKKKYSQLF